MKSKYIFFFSFYSTMMDDSQIKTELKKCIIYYRTLCIRVSIPKIDISAMKTDVKCVLNDFTTTNLKCINNFLGYLILLWWFVYFILFVYVKLVKKTFENDFSMWKIFQIFLFPIRWTPWIERRKTAVAFTE